MYKKEAVLIGAGKIGRGYMAYVFHKAGYKMTFLDYSDALIQKMNEQGYYTVFMQHREFGHGEITNFRIEGYEAYCTQTQYAQCVEVLSHANYATVHVYPGAIQSIGKMIADAAKKRMADGNPETLDVIFVINFLYADELFKKAALEALDTPEQKAYLEKYIGFVYGLVRGNGPTPNAEMLAMDPIAVACADSDYLPVDIDQMKGPMPEGVNFHAAHNVGGLVKYKVWGGNVSHCANAYFGKERGYTYNYESAQDAYIHKCAALCSREANHALEQEVKVVPEERERYFGRHEEQRFDPEAVDTTIKDTLDRVGADPIRKLGRNDRFVGPALLALHQGKVPFFLARGAAMGFYFTNPEDRAACEIQEYIKEKGIEAAIIKYCQLDLSVREENLLYQLILGNYWDISKQDPVDIHYCK